MDAEALPRTGLTSPVEVDGAVELWSSRELILAWRSRRDNWHNPCLLALASPDVDWLPTEHPAHRKGGKLNWFWRVDVTFGAWVVRAIRRAEQAKADLPEHELRSFRIVRNYLDELGLLAEVERIASVAPVRLPEIPTPLIDLARYGLVPRWEGWERMAESQAAEAIPAPGVPPVAPARPAPAPRRRFANDDRPKLF